MSYRFLLRSAALRRLALCALTLTAVAACAKGSPGTQVDLPDATVKPDGAVSDAPDDRADGTDTAVSTRCTSDESCAASPVGPVCDTVTGQCAQCTPARDNCPPGLVCEGATNTCVTGCRSDSDCGAGGVTRCDTATRRCVGCTADSDCALGTVCRTGACVPGCNEGHACGVGQTCCDGQCADLQASATNCGACGAACGSGSACCGGTCRVTATDSAHCGRCGNTCTASNGAPACVAGECSVGACNEGYGNCDGNGANGCESDLNTDAAHCGSCATACPTGPNATARCTMGRCQTECAGGFGNCDGNGANGCESDLNADPANCGACGAACPSGPNGTARCAMGLCSIVCAPGFGDCDGNPSNGCETSLSNTVTSCGACGVACRFANGNASCASSRCVLSTCAAGYDNCDGNADNGCETPTAGDSNNCGRCGNRCAPGTACSAGVCTSVCSGGTTFCTDRCAPLDSDASNCGACGRACASASNATAACRGGVCGLACDRGFGDCDGSSATGCETNLRTSTNHCGACGAACRAANATSACTDGACTVASCNPGFSNCNGNGADGCEVNTGADVANCGVCGRACALPNAGATCAGGTCVVGACASGFANCNGVDGDGCEVNTNTNNFNCGRCGVSCAPGTACSGGVCSTICSAGTTYCAGSCVALATDARNCGACGNVCAAGQTCSGGVCRVPPPSNDTCGAAAVLSLAAGSQTIALTTTGANNELASPCGFAGADVWYRFTLTQRELVYADTIGTGYDTVLYFASGCSTALSGSPTAGTALCNDDMSAVGCTTGGLQSQVVGLFGPGTYYLVVAGYGSQSGPATLHFQHLAVGGAVNTLAAGTTTVSGATSGSAGEYAPSCGFSTGPEAMWWWKTCPDHAGGSFTATTCSRASFDTILELRNAVGTGNACNDDSCGLQSTVTGSVPAGAGLHVLGLDGYNGASGSFSVQVTRP